MSPTAELLVKTFHGIPNMTIFRFWLYINLFKDGDVSEGDGCHTFKSSIGKVLNNSFDFDTIHDYVQSVNLNDPF